MNPKHQIFQLDLTDRSPLVQRAGVHLAKFLGIDGLNRFYSNLSPYHGGDPDVFIEKAVEALGISFELTPEDRAAIPATGPLVVVANHPFGGAEGLVLAALLKRIRPDVRVMANYLLQAVPELRDVFVFVDPFGRAESARANLKSMRDTLRWLGDGHVLAVFPSGSVSHLQLKQRKVADPEWSSTIGRIIRIAKCPVLPIYFGGRNSALFQIAGLVHPLLRTAMLPTEFLRRRQAPIDIRVGSAVPWAKLRQYDTDEDVIAFARQRVYSLRHRTAASADTSDPGTTVRRGLFRRPAPPAEMLPVIPPIPADVIEAELTALGPDALLVDGEMAVYQARAAAIPNTLRELGRLRELTFRPTGEGTGKPLDVDGFDNTYVQLFVYHRARREVVAGYRLGLTDEILSSPRGIKGLYTSTLFRFKPNTVQRISPAIELGRSFVRPEYQRQFQPLLLLWKGIGAFIARNPRYKILFGPVSISNTYSSVSKQLMVRFLQVRHGISELASRIVPRNPYRVRKPVPEWEGDSARLLQDIDDVSDLVSDIEHDRKGLPVLVRQYLKLGAKFLQFNVDPDFGNCVDGLILVDLRATDQRMVVRYMGKEAAAAFEAYHKAHELAAN